MSDCGKTSSPSSGNGGAPVVCTTGNCDPPCKKATIIKPKGSNASTSNPANSWLTTPCFHFDFQGVVSGSAGPYVLTIEGSVDPSPPYTPSWTLEAGAGTLANVTTIHQHTLHQRRWATVNWC